MLKIKILCVGKIKEDFYKDAIEEYRKRLKQKVKLEIIEVADEATDKPSLAKLREAEKILSKICQTDYCITLEIKGKSLTSEALADFIKGQMVSGCSSLVFIIGGSSGLDDKVIARSNYHLSFSSFTFPHQLMRVILIEQIYRSFKIMHNEPYHK